MNSASEQIRVEQREDVTIVTLTNKEILMGSDIQTLENSIFPLVEEATEINLVVDFCNVERITSAILGLLIRLSLRVDESRGSLKLCGISPELFKILKITKLDKVFDFCRDIEEAIESFN